MVVSIEGQGHFLTLFFQVLYILCLYEAQISGERLQDHWSSGIYSEITIYVLCVPVNKIIVKRRKEQGIEIIPSILHKTINGTISSYAGL